MIRSANRLSNSSIPKSTVYQMLTKSYMSTTTPTSTPLPPTISPDDLNSLLQNNPPPTSSSPRVIPLHSAWFMPNDSQSRTGPTSYQKLRIPGAKFFDLDEIKSKTSVYPHMLPTPKTFSDAMRAMNVTRRDTLVMYDWHETGIFSAQRVAWTVKAFGHERVSVLDNFKLWVDGGLPTESGEGGVGDGGGGSDGIRQIKEEDLYPIPELDSSMVATYEDVYDVAKASISSATMSHGKNKEEGKKKKKKTQILDARPAGRFHGTAPEPRQGLSSGHIPNSISIPFPTLLDPETKTFLPRDKVRQVLLDAGVDPDVKTEKIASCGTGVTAVIIQMALELGGFMEQDGKVRVYDGSWTEWAQRAADEDGMIEKN